jgi:hypothetical protein
MASTTDQTQLNIIAKSLANSKTSPVKPKTNNNNNSGN